MKRLTTALIAILSAATVLPVIAAPTCANIPELGGSVVLGVTGYYLQPSSTSDDLNFVLLGDGTNLFGDRVRHRYDWGYGLNAGYIIPCTAIDLGLSYFHIETRPHNKTITRDGFGTLASVVNIFNFPLTDPDAISPFNSFDAGAQVRYKIDQLSFGIGQFINFGCRFSFHPFIGARWAQLERRLNTDFVQSSLVTTTETVLQTQDVAMGENSRFNGIGPMVGSDAKYCLGCGWGVAGHVDTALLIGDTKVSTNETILQSTFIPGTFLNSAPDFANLNSETGTHVVPVFDAKLGLDYTWIFRCNSNSAMTLELGWMASYYFNSVDRLHTISILENSTAGGGVTPIVAAVDITGHSTSNIGLQGPYVSLIFRL